MPAVFDAESVQAQLAQAEQEKQHQIVINELRQILAEARIVEDGDFSNIEKQAGRKLSRESFEKSLKKLNPNIHFNRRPLGTEPRLDYDGLSECQMVNCAPGAFLKTLVWRRNDGDFAVCKYEDCEVLNEFDLLLTKPKVISRVALNKHSRENMLTDLPDYEIQRNPDGTPNVIFHGINNLQQVVNEPCGRVIGWRSTVARCVCEGLFSLDAAEREFDAADNESWAVRTGKQALIIGI